MSKYTTQLRWIVKQLSSGIDVPEGQEYPDAVYQYIGLNRYPIFNESYRKPLNDKIIDHFYFQEIGFETPAQFARMMRRTMNEVMPRYNRLYEMDALTIEEEVGIPISDFFRHVHDVTEGDSNQVRTYDVTDSETRDFEKKLTLGETNRETRDLTDNRTLNLQDSRTGESTSTDTKNLQNQDSFTNYHETETDTRRNVTTHGKTVDTTTSNTSNETIADRIIFEDTPMSMLNNQAQLPNVRDLSYATNVTYDDKTDAISESGTISTDEGGTTQDQKSGSLDREITGTKQTHQTGTDTVEKDYSETLTKTGLDTKTATGWTTSAKGGSNVEEQTGNGSTAKSGTVEDAGDKHVTRDSSEYGRNHTISWLMDEFNRKFVNIDMQVIAELEPLFMGVW